MPMELSGFVGQELACISLREVSAQHWPFELVAPVAAWYWTSTGFRGIAELAWEELQRLQWDAAIGCGSLDELTSRPWECALQNAYHRSLLEMVVPRLARWQLVCNELGQLGCAGPEGALLRGAHHGLLQIFPDALSLSAHLDLGLAQPAEVAAPIAQTLDRYAPNSTVRLAPILSRRK